MSEVAADADVCVLYCSQAKFNFKERAVYVCGKDHAFLSQSDVTMVPWNDYPTFNVMAIPGHVMLLNEPIAILHYAMLYFHSDWKLCFTVPYQYHVTMNLMQMQMQLEPSRFNLHNQMQKHFLT